MDFVVIPSYIEKFLEILVILDQLTIVTTAALKDMIKNHHTNNCHAEVKK